MKKLILLAFLLFQSVQSSAADELNPFYTRLLLQGSLYDIATAARAVNARPNYNQELADHCAFTLWKMASGEILIQEKDSWIVNNLFEVLNQNTTGRYKTLFKKILPKLSDNTEDVLLDKIEEAIENMQDTTGESFDIDLARLEKIKTDTDQIFLNAKQSRNSSFFYKMILGEHFNSAFSRFGLPDQVKGLKQRRGNATRRGSIRMEIQYDNLIRIGMINELDTKVGWYVFEVEYISDQLQPNPMDKLSTIEKIQTAHATQLREIAKALFNAKKYDRETMDAAMARAFKESKTTDTQLEDAVAWLCKYVGYSKDKSYMPKFLKLKQVTTNKKLKRYAIKLHRLLDDSDKKEEW